MGLFDKLINSAINAASDKISDNIQNKFTNSNEKKEYSLPDEFSSFPKYEGDIIDGPRRKTTEKYDRISLSFKGDSNNDYISNILSNGFIKASNVRYERGNTYIIVDPYYGNTEIVYHIKK